MEEKRHVSHQLQHKHKGREAEQPQRRIHLRVSLTALRLHCCVCVCPSVSGRDLVTKIRYDKPVKDLFHLLRDSSGHRVAHNETARLKLLADFIHQCTALDPQQRAKCEDLLKHPFIVSDD